MDKQSELEIAAGGWPDVRPLNGAKRPRLTIEGRPHQANVEPVRASARSSNRREQDMTERERGYRNGLLTAVVMILAMTLVGLWDGNFVPLWMPAVSIGVLLSLDALERRIRAYRRRNDDREISSTSAGRGA